MGDAEALPRSVTLAVALAFAGDVEPLLSLSARVRALCAIAAIDRELHRAVHAVALPRLAASFVPKEQLVEHATRTPPTLEWLALQSDRRVSALADQLAVSRPLLDTLDLRPRRTRVVALVDLGASQRLWALVPLKIQLRGRRAVCLSAFEARTQFRLSPADVSALRRAGAGASSALPMEAALDAALRRHGGAAWLERQQKAAVLAAVRRAEKAKDRAMRKEALALATGDAALWRRMTGQFVDLADAERKCLGGCVARREHVQCAAIDLFHARCGEIEGRRAGALAALPWPADGTRGVHMVPQVAWAGILEYALYGSPGDLIEAELFSYKWSRVIEVWAGAPSAVGDALSAASVTTPGSPVPEAAPAWVWSTVRAFLLMHANHSGRGHRKMQSDRVAWQEAVDAACAHNGRISAAHPSYVSAVTFRAAVASAGRQDATTVLTVALDLVQRQLAEAAHDKVCRLYDMESVGMADVGTH